MLILFLCLIFAVSATPSGIVSHWKLQSNADDIYSINNGFTSGNVNFGLGRVGKAAIFNGNNYIEIPDSNSLSPSTNGQKITVTFWMKPQTFNFNGENSGGYINFLGKNQNQNSEWNFRMYNDSNTPNRPRRISFYAFNLTGGLGAGSYFQDAAVNQWIHVTGVINGTHTQIYKNGILRDQDPLSGYGIVMGNGQAPVRIATVKNYSSTNFFIGSIDEVQIYNRALSSPQILTLYDQTPEPGYNSYWKFDGNALDQYGTNNGINFNNVIYGSGKFGQAANFNGANNYIQVLDNDILSPSSFGKMTIAFWLNPQTFSFQGQSVGYVRLLGKNTPSNSEFHFTLYNETAFDKVSRSKRITFNVYSLNGQSSAGSYFQENISANQWIHVVGVYDGSFTYIYYNGQLKDSDSASQVTMGNGNASFRIGSVSSSSYFKGSIDDLRVYTRVLSASQIQTLYNTQIL